MRADDWWAAASKPTPPHHLGHRERLRERAHRGLAALPDYELLELFLFRCLPQRRRQAAGQGAAGPLRLAGRRCWARRPRS